MRGNFKITGRHIDHDALRVWQFLLKEGGFWNARELGSALLSLSTPARLVCDRLVAAGMATSRQRPGEHPKFGVTAKCTAPPGYGWMLEVALYGTHPIDWAALEADERSDGPPLASSAPSGGSAVREATSVGASQA